MANAQPQSIPCVLITGGATRYANSTVPSNHAIFSKQPLPITTKFGYPLVMARLVENLPRGQETDNQHATWLNIDPEIGFAPAHWQGGIGDVIVANADGSPLSLDTLSAITDYVGDILEAFGDGEGAPTRMYNRTRLDAYIRRHLEN